MTATIGALGEAVVGETFRIGCGMTRAVPPGGVPEPPARPPTGFRLSAAHRGTVSPAAASCPSMRQPERHLSHRSNWLRAAVLGANDGIVSTASLVLGVAASGATRAAILTAGIAGLVAGALS